MTYLRMAGLWGGVFDPSDLGTRHGVTEGEMNMADTGSSTEKVMHIFLIHTKKIEHYIILPQ